MELKIEVPVSETDKLDKMFKDVFQVAAQKAYEAAVERAPAAGQTPYATGQMRQSLRLEKLSDYEYQIVCPMPYGIYNEFGTGPRGQATGAWPEFKLYADEDPYDKIKYHTGEVIVTRWRGRLLDKPYIRHTQGMEAQPFMRPALIEGVKWFEKLLTKYLM